MSNEGVSIPAPLFVTWYQCVITVLICWLAGNIGEQYQQLTSFLPVAHGNNDGTIIGQPNQPTQRPSFLAQIPRAEYDWGVANKVFPLSVIFVGMITFNNLCLKSVEVSFYDMAHLFHMVPVGHGKYIYNRLVFGSCRFGIFDGKSGRTQLFRYWDCGGCREQSLCVTQLHLYQKGALISLFYVCSAACILHSDEGIAILPLIKKC
jgi:hypothetical protein